MDVNSAHNHNPGYWFVLREDQGNVIFSSNNIATVQTPQIATVPTVVPETRYITEAIVSRPYIQEEQSEDSEKGLDRKRKAKEDDTFWDRNNVKLLLTQCLEHRNVPKETLWTEVGRLLGISPEDCSNKYKHLRRTYLRLLKKKRLGKHVKWVHYGTCEEVFTDLKALPPSVLEPWEDSKIRKLLCLYIDNLHKFRNQGYLQKDIWRDIGNQMGTTGYNCYHKFKNLRRTYLNGINRSQDNGKATKWSYHQYFERIYYNYKPLAKQWNRHKVKLLLDSYGQIAHKFKNPKLQKKELWREISMIVGESPASCDKKFRNMKQTYVRLKRNANIGRLTTKWRYYKDFESLYTNVTRFIEFKIDGTQKVVYRTCHEENYKKELLRFYIDNKHKFQDPLTKNRTLWKMIAAKLGLTAEECDKHFRNLKQTYIRLAWKKKQTGKCTDWPYFELFEKIYDNSEFVINDGNQKADIEEIMKSEIRRVVEDVTDRKDADRKFERLLRAAADSNQIQRERNQILQALLQRR